MRETGNAILTPKSRCEAQLPPPTVRKVRQGKAFSTKRPMKKEC
jgi:hypothetical protein